MLIDGALSSRIELNLTITAEVVGLPYPRAIALGVEKGLYHWLRSLVVVPVIATGVAGTGYAQGSFIVPPLTEQLILSLKGAGLGVGEDMGVNVLSRAIGEAVAGVYDVVGESAVVGSFVGVGILGTSSDLEDLIWGSLISEGVRGERAWDLASGIGRGIWLGMSGVSVSGVIAGAGSGAALSSPLSLSVF
jgi:hypothetical protein